MVASDHVGKSMSHRERFSDADLCGREFVDDVRGFWRRNVSSRAFAGLVKAIALEDSSLEAAILCRWRVWREDVASSLPCDSVRLSGLPLFGSADSSEQGDR